MAEPWHGSLLAVQHSGLRRGKVLDRGCHAAYISRLERTPRSSSGLGRQPLTLVTRVRVPYGAPQGPLFNKINTLAGLGQERLIYRIDLYFAADFFSTFRGVSKGGALPLMSHHTECAPLL